MSNIVETSKDIAELVHSLYSKISELEQALSDAESSHEETTRRMMEKDAQAHLLAQRLREMTAHRDAWRELGAERWELYLRERAGYPLEMHRPADKLEWEK